MKKIFIVANWKSNKTESEAKDWLSALSDLENQDLVNKEIIVCPSFVHLSPMKAFIDEHKLPIKLGVQDISPFSEGAYTGQVTASQVAGLASYSIVGHSEKRKYFHETNEDIISKLKLLFKNKIIPILCIGSMTQMDYYLTHEELIIGHGEDIIFVYEPPDAISGGGEYHAETPENANKNAGEISHKLGKRAVTLYGGSVNSANVFSLFSQRNIDGGLIGQASLDAKEFYKIIQNT